MSNITQNPRALKAEYRNPWYSLKGSDPAIYITDATPKEYRGLLIYHRIKSSNPSGNCWDIVLNGVAVGQYAGLRGGFWAIDEAFENKSYSRVRDNVLEHLGAEVLAGLLAEKKAVAA